MIVTNHQTCRICRSQLTEILSLGDQWLQGSFVKGDIQPSTRKVPLNLMWCDQEKSEDACGLVQLQHTINSNVLYRNYWYASGTSQTMTSHLQELARNITALRPSAPLKVLDIGCNDGTLLKAYPDTVEKWGVDPASIAVRSVDKAVHFIPESYPNLAIDKEKFDVITTIAMFYDLEEPESFVNRIRRNLKDDGLWVMECAYLPLMLKNNAYDNICHEHIEYYSLSVIEDLLRPYGLKVFRAETNSINCGSIQCWITPIENQQVGSWGNWEQELNDLRQAEFDMALDTAAPYVAFRQRVLKAISALKSTVEGLVADGNRIHLYGASTKGNTILQSCGIDHTLIPFAAERNPDKWGAKTLGTNIEILSEEASRAMQPDYYLVLPWHFKREFLEREKDTKAKFIFPLPELEVV